MANTDDILNDNDDFNELSNQFDELEKDLTDLSGKKETSLSAVMSAEEEEETAGDKRYYFLLPPDKNIAKIDVFKVFSKMEDVVPGQLVLSVYDLSENINLLTEFKAGNNIAVTADGKQFYSTAQGQISWWGNLISVEKNKKIDGDLTSVGGALEYDSVLIVNGNIADEVKLKVNGDLYVLENIGKADIEVKGNIFVRNGIRGRNGGFVKATGNIIAKFVENSNISSDSNIIINDAIMHSKVSAANKVIVNGAQKRLIVGGSVCAGMEIAAGVLGSEAYTVTELTVGLLGSEKEELAHLQADRTGLKNRISQLDLDISQLVTKKSAGNFSEENATKLEMLKKEKQQTTIKLNEINKKIEKCELVFQSRTHGCISASELLYPGIKISINNTVAPINNPVKNTTVVAKNSELKFEPYKAPVIPSDSMQSLKPEEHQPLNFNDANIVRKSIIISAVNEISAADKAVELLRLNKNTSVYTVLDVSNQSKNPYCKIRLVEVKQGENPKKIKQKITPFDKNKSVVVEAETIESALQKVSRYFNVSVDKLDYTVIQQKAGGLLGMGSKTCQLKVWLKREPQQQSREQLKDQLASSIGNDMDGYFTIQNTEDGLVLNVYPARGSGKQIEEADIVKELNLYNYNTNINFELITEAVSNPTGSAVKIAQRQSEPDFDGKFEIKISEDKLKAAIILYPPMDNGRPVQKETALAKIQELGIKNIKNYVLDGLFDGQLPIYCEEIVFAEGKPKVEGKDAAIDFKINVSDEKMVNFKEDESGKIDFHEMGLIENVVAGQTLARKIPASIGKNGEDIFGNIITAEDGKDMQLTPGKNVTLSDDGMELIADIDGLVGYDGKKLRVDPIYHVNGDVSYETGNITFLGTVIVTGVVRDDFVIRASGDVFVGSVAAAEIEAEGNVIIRGGISGREKAMIKSGASVVSKFVEQANIIAAKNVVVQEAIMHSNISAGGTIICLEGKRGLIVGGIIRAGEEIFCKELGSKIATKTYVEVGIDPAVRQSIAELEQKLREQKENFDRVRKGIKALSLLKKKLGALPPQKETLLLELVGLNRVLNTKLLSIQQELKSLQTKMRESGKGKLCVSGTVYTGIKVVVKNAIMHIDEELTYARFFYDNGEVKISQYEEPSNKLMEQLKTDIKEPKK